ncbi:MAG: PAS domain-containing sensor histidine kinase [Bacteroidales bacterium]|nr:PAS domain-containing sensor histidine kinase [Bacteroidales bacterium]
MESNNCSISGQDFLISESNKNFDSDLFSVQNTLLECIDGFYFKLDIHKKILFISDSVKENLGYNPKELLNKPFNIIIADVSKELFENQVRLIMESDSRKKEKVRSETEIEFVDKSKSTHHYELILTNKYLDNSGELYILGICKDISKQKFKERALHLAKNKAETSDKMKSEFLANMSHEIRTPLNGIIGFSTMIERNAVDKEKRDKYLRIIRTSTSQLLTIVNDIIDISKIEAGQLKLVYHKVELHAMLEDLLETFESEAARLGKDDVNFKIKKNSPDNKFHFTSDEVRLRQVFSNLLINALKFTDSGTIEFGYKILKDSLRFFVLDSGIGIPETHLKRIFSRYKQTSEGVKSKYEGTGLGLAISDGIVKLLGGEIGVKSEKGKGSEFYFTLPVK